MEYKEDIRIQKSKRDLRCSLTELLIQRPIEKISVKEICDHALINRMTFYKYYEDKFQLLDDIFYELKNTLITRIPKRELNTILDYQELCCDMLEESLNICDENIELFHALKKNSNMEILGIITKISESSLNDLFTEISKIKPLKYSIPFISSFIYGGFFATTNYWLEHPSQKNKEQIHIMINDLRHNVMDYSLFFKE